jgi:hypothetical protein
MISGIGARNPVLLIRKRRCVGIERFDAGEINDTQPVKLPDILIGLRHSKTGEGAPEWLIETVKIALAVKRALRLW